MWTPTPQVVWEPDELMEETTQSRQTSGSESVSQLPAGWEQVWEGIPKARSLSEAPRSITHFVVRVRDPNPAVRDTLAAQPSPTSTISVR